MSRCAAVSLWGSEAVAEALAYPWPDPATVDLACEVGARADPPGAFRAWSLTQPWPRYCAIVRLVTGNTQEELWNGRDNDPTA